MQICSDTLLTTFLLDLLMTSFMNLSSLALVLLVHLINYPLLSQLSNM